MTKIHPIRLTIAHAYVVVGERPILIDTGWPNEEATILAALRAAGFGPRDLSLILLTHGHSDHAGSAAELRQLSQAPVALHEADHDMVRRGRNEHLQPTGLLGWLFSPIANGPFPTFEPDLQLEPGDRLDKFGIAGEILHTPGHTPGSVSLLLDSGEVFAGDLLMGGYLGGYLFPGTPQLPWYADDLQVVYDSIEKLLARGATLFYLGHGGPVTAGAIEKWLTRVRPARR